MVAGMDAWVNEWKMMNVHRVRNEEWLYFMSLGGVSNPPQIISLELHWSSHSVHQSVSQSVTQSANYHDAIHVLYKLLYMRRPQTHTHAYSIMCYHTTASISLVYWEDRLGWCECDLIESKKFALLLTLRALGWAFLPFSGKWRAHLLGYTSSGRRGNGCLVWTLGDQPRKRGWACVIGRNVFWCLSCLFTY